MNFHAAKIRKCCEQTTLSLKNAVYKQHIYKIKRKVGYSFPLLPEFASLLLFYHHLLRLHIVIDEAQHIHTRRHSARRDAPRASVTRGLEQVHIRARHIINKVQIAHLHAFGVHREGVGAVLLRLEIHRNLVCRDVPWCVSTIGYADHGIVVAVLRDIDLGVVVPHLELGQLAAFTKADNGTVDDTTAMAEVEGKSLALTKSQITEWDYAKLPNEIMPNYRMES